MKKSLKNLLNQLNLIENKAVFFRDKEDGEVFSGFSSDINKKLELVKRMKFTSKFGLLIILIQFEILWNR